MTLRAAADGHEPLYRVGLGVGQLQDLPDAQGDALIERPEQVAATVPQGQSGDDAARPVAEDRDAVAARVGEQQAVGPMAGRYHLCPDLVFLATAPYGGALVELMAVDARNLYLIPDQMTYGQGALLEPLSVGIWGCKRAGRSAQ